MPATEYVGTEIDAKTREAAARVLEAMGLTLSEFLRLTVSKIARDKCLPFDAEAALDEEFGEEIPNEETRQAMEAVERRKGLFRAKDSDDLFRQLGI